MKKILLLSLISSSIFSMQQPNRVEDNKLQEKSFTYNPATNEYSPLNQTNDNACLSNAKRYAIAAGRVAYLLNSTVCYASVVMPQLSPVKVIGTAALFAAEIAINAPVVQTHDHE